MFRSIADFRLIEHLSGTTLICKKIIIFSANTEKLFAMGWKQGREHSVRWSDRHITELNLTIIIGVARLYVLCSKNWCLFFLLGKTMSAPSYSWRERPGQSGHYCSSIARCDHNEGSVHMRPTPLLRIGSNPSPIRDPELCSQHLFPPPSHSLPVSSWL